MKTAAAVLGIVCLIGTASAQNGTASAQNKSPLAGNTIGATVPGVPTTTYARPDDSTSGVTQATPANQAMTCNTGYVVSGGQCVLLSSILPQTPDCAYGQVRSGGQCIALPGTQPPPTNCPSGQVLSGGVCVPLPTSTTQGCGSQPATTQYIPCPTGQTGGITQTRTGTCALTVAGPALPSWVMTPWSTTSNTCAGASPVCPSQPASTQTLSCSSGQIGQISQMRSLTCNSSTGYSWSTGSWYTTSNSCVSTPSCPAQPAISQTVACPSGQTGQVTQSRTATCSASTGYTWNLGSWYQTATTCATPAPTSCNAKPVSQYWGAGCSYNGTLPQTAVGSTTTIYNQAAGFKETGFQTYRCNSGPAGWSLTGQDCQVKPPPAAVGCASQTINEYIGAGQSCPFTVPAASNAQIVTVPDSALQWQWVGTATYQCFNGSWTKVSVSCWFDNP